MRSYISLRNAPRTPLPEPFSGDDVRYPESLVVRFLEEFTRPGDLVFDPFAGFGTTLQTAEAMGRVPYGIEFDPQRVEYARSRLRQAENLLHGDSRQLASYPLPAFDFSITSPPYMNRHDREDPFTNYATEGEGYAQYLRDIQSIYRQMRDIMKPQARAVIEVSNLKRDGLVTTLAWDIAAAVSELLSFEGEIVVAWEETYGYGYDHSYCLVYRKR